MHNSESVKKPGSAEPEARLNASIAEVMSKNVISVSPSLSLSELILLLVDHGISGCPVVDQNGRPIGVVSKTDLLHESYEDADQGENARPFAYSSSMTVGQVMNSPAVTLSTKATVADAARLMTVENVHRIPVVSDTGVVIGIVGALDILRWLSFGRGPVPAAKHVRRK
jgi:CBS domain-containing protein